MNSAHDSLQQTRQRILQASALLVGSMVLSRVVGFFREWILAQSVGASGLTDTYYASFTIPDLLNHFMAMGAFSASLIPILSELLSKGRKELCEKLIRSLLSWLGTFAFILIAIAMYFAGGLSSWIAPGLSEEQLTLLASLTRIILPAQFFFLVGGVATAVQHTHKRFLLPAISPVIYNLGIILFGLWMRENHGVMGFSVGVTAGAFVGHGVLGWYGLRKLGYSVIPTWAVPPEIFTLMRRYLLTSIPVMVGMSIVVTDEWYGKYFASFQVPRAISWLSYARTLMRIPIAIIGQVAGIASFPFLASYWANRDYRAFISTFSHEAMKLWVLSLLAVVLLYNHSLAVTHFIYGGSRFQPDDYLNTARALEMFAIGIPAWIYQVLLTRGFYACQLYWWPSLVGTLISILCFPFYYFFSFSHSGLALAGTVSITLYTGVLWVLFSRHLKKTVSDFSLVPLYKSGLAWIPIVAILWAISWFVRSLGIYQGTQLSALLEILVSIIILGVPLLFKLRRSPV